MKKFGLVVMVHTLVVLALVGTGSAKVPEYFRNEMMTSNYDRPINLAFVPDGSERVLIGQQNGEIFIADVSKRPVKKELFFVVPNVDSNEERGLQDMIFDVDFKNHPYLYVVYSPLSDNNKLGMTVARYTFSQNGGGLKSRPKNQKIIYRDPHGLSDSNNHCSGSLSFGPDGYLYVATGDQFTSASQFIKNNIGKVLRMTRAGVYPQDNYGVEYDGRNGDMHDSIWALGLRNPFTSVWDLETERYFIGDVGDNDHSIAYESIFLGKKGGNYGWPFCQGLCDGNPAYPKCDCNKHEDPIFTYFHEMNNAAVILGFVYRGNEFPKVYRESLFYGDYARGEINFLTFFSNGKTVKSSTAFEDDAGLIVELVPGPNGDIYYSTLDGQVRRIRYVGKSSISIKSVKADKVEGNSPLKVKFEVDAVDNQGGSLSYKWNFGNGNTGTTKTATATYLSGVYWAFVTVSSNSGSEKIESDLMSIQVGTKPFVKILTPKPGATFDAGDTIRFRGNTKLGGEEVSKVWKVRFHHDNHFHPVTAEKSDDKIVIQKTGHDFTGNTWLEFELIGTSKTGVTNSQVVKVRPNKSKIKIVTQPSGLSVAMDNIVRRTPLSFESVKGFEHSLSVPGFYCINEVSYNFQSWSNQKSRRHTFTVPSSDVTLVAKYVKGGSCIGQGGGTTTTTSAPSTAKVPSSLQAKLVALRKLGRSTNRSLFATRGTNIKNLVIQNFRRASRATLVVVAEESLRNARTLMSCVWSKNADIKCPDIKFLYQASTGPIKELQALL